MALDEIIQSLRDGKADLRRNRQAAPLQVKLHDLWRSQHLYTQIVSMRRPLMAWERPWNIMNDVRDSVIVRDGVMESFHRRGFSASTCQLVSPLKRWILSV